MTWGDDVLTVLPGTLDEEALRARLAGADAAVVMKLGRNLPQGPRGPRCRGVVGACRLRRARHDGGPKFVMPLIEKPDDVAPYFAIVLVPGRGRRP